mgnify:CR=1 FL=1
MVLLQDGFSLRDVHMECKEKADFTYSPNANKYLYVVKLPILLHVQN